MKRVWSLCLALLLLVQMGLPVFADAGLAGQNSATGQLDPSAVYLEKENPDVGVDKLLEEAILKLSKGNIEQ